MTTALEQQPTNKPSRQSIDTLVALYNTGDLYRLIEDAKALLDVYPDTFVVWNILGAAAAQIGNEALAESAFEKTIEIEPGFADGHNNLGNILLQQQKCEQAVSAFQQAIKRQPDNSNTLNNLALALLQSDKPSEALPVLQSALNINPDCATSFLYLGDVYTKLNQSALAIQAFEHATAIDHKMANAFKSIGRMLCQQG
ncbi:MAG: tetratricopeptide repeat protein, partial [Pseudomonadota bacterium]